MAWEQVWIQAANAFWASPFLDRVLPWFTHLGSHLAVLAFILFSFLRARTRSASGKLVLLYGIQSAVVYGLKFLVRRERPSLSQELVLRFAKGPGEILDPSFPSAHALYAFMMATLLARRFPRWRFLFYLGAGLVGWSRIYLGLHYPTDVAAGGLLGYGLTKLLLHLEAARKATR